jgi:hypothetical protein
MDSNYYKMFPELHFALVMFHTEHLTIDDAQTINLDYKSDPHYSTIESLLVIVENCIPAFEAKDLSKLSELYNTPLQTNYHKKVVWLVTSPLLTAFTHLFVSLTDGNLYCSTIEQAYKLLDLHVSFLDFKILISEHLKIE